MNCEKFLEWLDNGGTGVGSVEAKPFQEHVATCQGCQLAARQIEKRMAILQGLKADDLILARIHQNISKRIEQMEKKASPASSQDWNFFFRLLKTPVFAFFATTFIILSSFLIFKSSGTHPIVPEKPVVAELAYLSGKAWVGRQRGKIALNTLGKEFALILDDCVSFSEDEPVTIRYPDNRLVRISGEGECRITEALSLVTGLGEFTFQGSIVGYRIQLPSVNLVIRGTKLHLKAGKAGDTVWVQEGKIDWSTPGGHHGNLSAGSGLSFSGGIQTKLLSSPLSKNPPDPRSENSPNDTSPVAPALPGGENGTERK